MGLWASMLRPKTGTSVAGWARVAGWGSPSSTGPSMWEDSIPDVVRVEGAPTEVMAGMEFEVGSWVVVWTRKNVCAVMARRSPRKPCWRVRHLGLLVLPLDGISRSGAGSIGRAPGSSVFVSGDGARST